MAESCLKESTSLLCLSVRKDKHADGGSPESVDKSISTTVRGLVHAGKVESLARFVVPTECQAPAKASSKCLQRISLAASTSTSSSLAFNSSAASAPGISALAVRWQSSDRHRRRPRFSDHGRTHSAQLKVLLRSFFFFWLDPRPIGSCHLDALRLVMMMMTMKMMIQIQIQIQIQNRPWQQVATLTSTAPEGELTLRKTHNSRPRS